MLWGVFSYQLANDDTHVSENALCKTGDTMKRHDIRRYVKTDDHIELNCLKSCKEKGIQFFKSKLSKFMILLFVFFEICFILFSF